MAATGESGDRYVVIFADTHAGAPVAAEIGSTVEEVVTPLGDTGYRAPAAFQYRPFEGGLALRRLAPAAVYLGPYEGGRG